MAGIKAGTGAVSSWGGAKRASTSAGKPTTSPLGGGGGDGAKLSNDNTKKINKSTETGSKAKTKKKVKGKVNVYTEGDMTVMPNVQYKKGLVFACKGLGPLFSGNYYVQKVVHKIGGDGYSTNLSLIQVQKSLAEVTPTRLETAPAEGAPKNASNPKNIEVQVEPGQTLWQIAVKYGTTTEELARINGIKDYKEIKPGQNLKLREDHYVIRR